MPADGRWDLTWRLKGYYNPWNFCSTPICVTRGYRFITPLFNCPIFHKVGWTLNFAFTVWTVILKLLCYGKQCRWKYIGSYTPSLHTTHWLLSLMYVSKKPNLLLAVTSVVRGNQSIDVPDRSHLLVKMSTLPFKLIKRHELIQQKASGTSNSPKASYQRTVLYKEVYKKSWHLYETPSTGFVHWEAMIWQPGWLSKEGRLQTGRPPSRLWWSFIARKAASLTCQRR